VAERAIRSWVLPTHFGQESFAAAGSAVSLVDVERVPAFAPQFPLVLTIEQLASYHSDTVRPMCLKIVRDQLFTAVRLAARVAR
jgi:hypothetical protein